MYIIKTWERVVKLGLIIITSLVLLVGCNGGEEDNDGVEEVKENVERSDVTGIARELTKLIHGKQPLGDMGEVYREIVSDIDVSEDVYEEWFDFDEQSVQRKYVLGMVNDSYSEEYTFFEERDERGETVYVVGVLSEVHKVPEDEPHHDFLYDTFDMFTFDAEGNLVEYSRHW